MPVSIDDEERAGDLLREWISYVYTHHEIRREVRAPRPRVVQIVFGVERIVPDKTAKDSALDRQPFADRSEIRNIRRSQVAEKLEAAHIGRRRGKSKQLDVFPCLRRQLHAPARLLVSFFPKIECRAVDVRPVGMPSRAATAKDSILWMIEVEQVRRIDESAIMPLGLCWLGCRAWRP